MAFTGVLLHGGKTVGAGGDVRVGKATNSKAALHLLVFWGCCRMFLELRKQSLLEEQPG